MSALDPIRARLAAATPGPWFWDEKYDPDKDGDSGLALTNNDGVEIVGAYNHHCCAYRDDPTVKDEDAPLIANAPTDMAHLLAALDAVTALVDRTTRAPLEYSATYLAHDIQDAIAEALEGKQ